VTPLLAQRLGTDRSFERLYRKHAGDVYRYALVVLRNEADAEDVTQTTFLNAYRAFEQGERPRAPQNWLIAIAHNVCRQRFRQSQRRPNEVAFEEELAEATVVDDDAVSAEDIRRALGHLAFRARRALREQLEDGITCHEAEFAISRQLDGRLPRKERGALRGHLRECEECAGFARSQRAQRGSLKSLALIPLPQSLAGLFGGGGGTAVGGGIAVKAAAIGASALVASGVGYEGVKHGIWKPPAASRAAVAQHAKKPAPAAKPVVLGAASVVTPAQDVRHDQKPFTRKAVKVRRVHREKQGRSAAVKPERLAKPVHREVSTLPPSRDHIQKPKKTKPDKTEKTKPDKAEKPDKNHGHGQGTGKPDKPKDKVKPPVATEPTVPTEPAPPAEHGKSNH
jgi:RNA polymerase sigma-70 factor (ECF subfamily)